MSDFSVSTNGDLRIDGTDVWVKYIFFGPSLSGPITFGEAENSILLPPRLRDSWLAFKTRKTWSPSWPSVQVSRFAAEKHIC